MYQGRQSIHDPIRAAQYVRMSTDHQQYSIDNQVEVIARYAQRHNMQIVCTYSDAAKSGIRVSRRKGILELIQDVVSGCATYSAILVYDVSRWGRFQDADESAYYEYICRKANVQVHYCAEQFDNDGMLSSSILKNIKRAMAGEYSRELSAKVFAGQSHLVELGFRLGGPPGYGFRRQLVDRDGNVRGLLSPGERKSIHSDRVVLVPGPENEIAVIREIYRQFTEELKKEVAIARSLNEQGIPSENGRGWTRDVVHQILTNPKYIGHNVFNRVSFKLQRKLVRNPPEMWVVRPDAFVPIVSKEQFARAAEIRQHRDRLNRDRHLEQLRGLLATHGRLSLSLMKAAGLEGREVLQKRFGSLAQVYRLLGYQSGRSYSFAEGRLMLRELQSRACVSIIDRLQKNGVTVLQNPENGILTINDEFTACVVIVPWYQKGRGRSWIIRKEPRPRTDITLAVRLAPGDKAILDYYVVPMAERWVTSHLNLRLCSHSRTLFRFASLDFFVSMGRRVGLEAVV